MVISVDIGGTNTRVAQSEDGKTIRKKTSYHTPQNFNEAIDSLVIAVSDLVSAPSAVVLGIAGAVDKTAGSVTKAPHIHEYENQPIKKILEERLQTIVKMENDAALAGLAEAILGAGQGFKVVGYLTLSTGVGGAKVINGVVNEDQDSIEPGHQIVDPNGPFWPACGQTGCFESLSSGSAFEKKYNIKPENCQDPTIWDEHARVTSKGLVKIIQLWSPDILVLGGSLTKAGDKFIQPLIKYTKAGLQSQQIPEIKVATLGDDSGLLGGLALLT